MAKRVKLIQQRPNSDVAWHNASDEFKTLKETYVSAGKLDDQGGVVSGSDLIKTWTLVFPNDDNYTEFLNEPVRLTYYNDMQLYNEQNGISDSIDIQEI
mgnify:CR=1 FL=1|tara:strand:- start:5217 stop:5513 length:297 start_codon:yes stop_codon:yes gene_type:complete